MRLGLGATEARASASSSWAATRDAAGDDYELARCVSRGLELADGDAAEEVLMSTIHAATV